MSQPIVVPSGPAPEQRVVLPRGTRGIEGPRGPAGILLVRHGADPDHPRPDTSEMVLWRGSVQPANWDTSQDLWLREE